KSAHDVAKLMCLGADRCGFATFAMVSIGCTICRGCQLDTCHVGIATQIESVAEATARGIKKFEPQELERAVENLQRSFGAMREELAKIAGQLGVERTADLVGRTDLLVQARGLDRVDLGALTRQATEARSGTLALSRRDSDPLPRDEMDASSLEPTTAAVAILDARDRFVGTPRSGEMARARIFGGETPELRIAFGGGSVAGNGAAAYATDGLAITINGGAQDGAAKTALGGSVAVLKAPNASGRHVDGSVGKCFAYGAQRGRFLVQGSADARAGIRLSGADVVIGGDVKGFAFEYMTWGRAVILGDVGRWICSGMSGGMVFVRHDPARGLDDAGLRDRLAKGAKVSVRQLTDEDHTALEDLLGSYVDALAASGQTEEAATVRALLWTPDAFRVIKPGGEIVDQSISTE
ncbi:MAG: glutamate synthase, partial [Chloroflexi bacterium]|nr:glutamate synthase [Chloroflexota bacterium]